MKVAQIAVKDAEKAVKDTFAALQKVDGKKDHKSLSDSALAYAKAVQVFRSAKAREAADPLAGVIG